MAAAPWPVAKLDTVGDLARYLGLTSTELAWFADVRSMERAYPDERLRYYRYRWAPKPTGGARLIEEPKRRLKGFQRMLLADTVGPIPAHPAAHGFRRGLSAITHAANHQRRAVVVRMDLEDFFAAVTAGRVHGILRAPVTQNPSPTC